MKQSLVHIPCALQVYRSHYQSHDHYSTGHVTMTNLCVKGYIPGYPP